MNASRRSIIFCEGFDDRAFLDGWLTALGFADPGHSPGASRKPVSDPFTGTRVTMGHHAWTSNTGTFLVVVPCSGDTGVLRALDIELQRRSSQRLDRVVVCLDDDGKGEAARRDAVADRVQKAGGSRTANGDGDWSVDATVVSAVIWRCDDPHTAGVPREQTLERVVCAAICDAHRSRGAAVDAWLRGRPDAAPPAGHKAHSWSHMAGWYAEGGCTKFLQDIWSDGAVRSALEERLRASGAWRGIHALL